jgi:hypothetical protein
MLSRIEAGAVHFRAGGAGVSYLLGFEAGPQLVTRQLRELRKAGLVRLQADENRHGRGSVVLTASGRLALANLGQM